MRACLDIEIELLVPLGITLVINLVCPTLNASKAYNTVGIDQVLVESTPMQVLLDILHIFWVHLRKVFSTIDTNGQSS